MKGLLSICAVLAAAIAVLLLLPGPAEPSQGTTAIIEVRVFDGDEMIDNATVLIAEGRITAVGTDLTPPEGSEIVEGRGRTLLPGLIDAHVHAYGAARSDALRMGVTTLLDMFRSPMDQPMIIEQRRSLRPTTQSDLFSAGFLATAEGGHGTQYGLPVPIPESPETADQWVAQRLDEGSDYIKIIIEDGSGWGRPLPTLDAAMVEALVDAAHDRGVLAVAHVSTLSAAKMAVLSGVDGLVHLFADEAVDTAFLDMAREAGIWIIPTASVLAATHGQPVPDWLTEGNDAETRINGQQRAMLGQSFPGAQMRSARWPLVLDNIRRVHEAGIPLLAGSDAGNPGTAHGPSVHHEMALLVESGLTPVEALRAATSRPAQAFRLDERGCIRPGCRADLILIDGDPLADIRQTVQIDSIWKNGTPVGARSAGGDES